MSFSKLAAVEGMRKMQKRSFFKVSGRSRRSTQRNRLFSNLLAIHGDQQRLIHLLFRIPSHSRRAKNAEIVTC